MQVRMLVASFGVGPFLMMLGGNSIGQDPPCDVAGPIPCVVQWYNLSTVLSRTESHARAVAILQSGDVLVPGVSKNETVTDRVVFKFGADGTPVYGFSIEGIPWYIGTNSATDYSQFPCQKILLDE